MQNSLLFVALMALHFISDFVLQPREMAKNKSENMGYLSLHVTIQFVVFVIGLHLLGYDRDTIMVFSIFNMLIHGLIDRYVWRLYKRVALWREPKELIEGDTFKFWEDHWFYMTIGFDQLLHITTLALLAGMLL